MNDMLLTSLSTSIALQKQKFDNDVLKYKNEIDQVLKANGTDPNGQRMLLGKLFIHALKQEMGYGLVKAGIFGSTSRNEAKEGSDVDIALFIQPLTTEEKKIHNDFKLQFERGYGAYAIFNVANNSHRIDELERVFSETTKIPVRSMKYNYDQKDFDDIQNEIKFITILE